MVETVGRKLQRARIARRLSIEEVADATKIRPERVIDLEADEYGHFANLTYAKSFLAKYAKFLGVDIQEELDHFQVNHSISLRDYQYLAPSRPRSILKSRKVKVKGFRVPPLVVLLLVLILLVGVPLFSYMTVNVPRLRGGAIEGRAARDQLAAEAPTPAVAGPAASESPGSLAGMPSGTQGPVADLAARPSSSTQVGNQAAALPSAPSDSRVEDGVQVRRALPVDQGAPADSPGTTRGISTPDLTTGPQTKLELRVLKRTWVKVTKDEEDSEPVFDGFAGPEDQPIVVEGKRFWVKIHDKGAVEVRKNGQRVLNSSGDIVID
jgi:cytoskeletal protein RodZ